MPNKGTISRQCAICGTSFMVRAHSVAIGRGLYCSLQCSGTAKRGVPKRPVEDRFWEKVDRNGPTPEHCPELGPCWVWTGSRHPDGRGQIHFRGRTYVASIVAYILTYGELPADKPCVLHKCDGGPIACVRPDHLFAGTIADNASDMVKKGRHEGGAWTKTKPERLARGDRHGSKTMPDRVPRGDSHPLAVLTEDIVRTARARYAAGGVAVRHLAEEVGVSKMALYNAIRRFTWKHVV